MQDRSSVRLAMSVLGASGPPPPCVFISSPCELSKAWPCVFSLVAQLLLLCLARTGCLMFRKVITYPCCSHYGVKSQLFLRTQPVNWATDVQRDVSLFLNIKMKFT